MAAEKLARLTGKYDKALDEPGLTPDEVRDALDRAAARKRALRRYLELVQEIPEVVAVTLCPDEQILYTVIMAVREDREVSSRVYDAQAEIMRDWNQIPFEFRLVSCHGCKLDRSFYNQHHISSDIAWER